MTKKKTTRKAAAALNDEMLERIAAQLVRKNDLLAVIACATARTMELIEHEHRLRYPQAAIQVKDPAGLAARVRKAMTAIAVDEILAPAVGESDE